MAERKQDLEAAGREEPSPLERSECRVSGESFRDDDALLSLSHFSRPPFLSFGTVRVGTSCVRRLAVENPNAEPVHCAVSRPPPVSKGFTVDHRSFFIRPGERIFILITWTPLQGGKVRELITFIVNDVVKYQAVLLGNAEQPIKKKKSLWDTIKRRNPAQQSRKRLPVLRSVNKTFQMSEKTGRNRSPLQPCENLAANSDRISPNGNSLIISEDELSLSPIGSILQENQHVIDTPLTTMHFVPGANTSEKLLINITETYTVLPLCNNLVGKKLKSNHTIISTELSASSASTPEQLKPVLNHRRILSPDSFINNSYNAAEELDRTAAVPILSPDQFLRENQIVIQSTSQEHKPVSFSSNMKSCVTTADFPKQKEKAQVTAFSVEPQLSIKDFNLNDRNYKTFCYDKREETASRARINNQACCIQNKKRPLLSSTVTKSKPNPEGKGTEMLKLKSKKCLTNAIQQCVDNAKLDTLLGLPVIEGVSDEDECLKAKAAYYLESSSCTCKRKREYLDDVKERKECLETKNVLLSCEGNGSKSGLESLVSKSLKGGKQTQKKRHGSTNQKSKTFIRRTKNTVPVAQSHLTFVKPLKTDIPRHPMPFVAKNMFYDEQWKKKQQLGFTWWLNFVLTPDDFTLKTDISQVNTASLILGSEIYKSSVPKAPTKEEASLRAYTTRCKLNKLRRSACRLFSCDEMVKAIKRLEIEIEAKRLLVRKDRHLWKDIGERQKILSWLLCYNPLWLRIGLETIFGELIALENNCDVMSLAIFILNRLLWNPDIAAEYRHPSVPHLYRYGHEEALSKFTLKKLLLLVCFLDRAKLSRIIEHDPCLFFRTAEFKSSKEILLAFSRDFLSGEGDLSRHLGFLGFPVNHVQTPLDEFDFAVTNLATDLQCGIRLVRTLELLSSDWSLSKNLRVPAISRLQKVHNVNLAFLILKDRGIQLKDEYGSTILPKDIVDGHREKTFALLWKIVFAFQVNVSLDTDQLKEEIAFLKNMYVAKLKRAVAEPYLSNMGNDSSRSSFESYGENVKLLMEWVNVVCGFYNIKVENFTVSFSDGRALCYLIHHYHPCYMPLEAICKCTTQTIECTRSGTLAVDSSSESDASLNLLSGTFDQTITTSVLYKELLENEKRNFQLISAAVSELGGIPAMIHHSDMSNTIPDEKVVITYVSYLCSRLLCLSKEIRAAQLIQSAWRKHSLKIKLAQTETQKCNAVVLIQRHWRRYLAQMELQKLKKAKQEETGNAVVQRWEDAAVVLQAWFRMKRQRRQFLRLSRAASVIQMHYRAHKEQTSQRQRFLQMKQAALCLQANYRGYKQRMLRHQTMAAIKIQVAYKAYGAGIKYQALNQAALVIQRWYRACRSGCKVKRSFLKTKAAATSLQAAFRGWQVRKWVWKQHAAAVTLQSAFRRYTAMKQFRMVRNATLTLQQHYRAHILAREQQQHYIVLCKSTILLQATWRGTIVRKQIEIQRQAAVTIQSFYRMHVNQTKFRRFREAAITIQRWYYAALRARNQWQKYLALKEVTIKMQAIYRGSRIRRKMQCMNQAAICIQSMFKMHRSNTKYKKMKRSATIIQKRFSSFSKGQKERKKYLALRKSTLLLQAAYRGMKIRQDFKSRQQCVITIQSYYRMYRERKSYLKLVEATKCIQQWYRACRDKNIQMQKFRVMKISALRIQAAFRGTKARATLKKIHMAASIIQRSFKTFLQRQHFIVLKAAVVTIQRKYRATVLSNQQHRKFLSLRTAVIVIQAAFRSFLVRKRVKQMHLAAAVIQATFKMRIAHTQYKVMKSASVTIQQRYRAYQKTKQIRELYLKQRHSALVLQAGYRGMKVRGMLRKELAATVIQSNYRKLRQQRFYRKIQLAVRIVQRRVRANRQSKIAAQQYSSIKEAAVCIQRAFRRMTARRYQKRHWAAMILQRNFKMQRERKNYLTLKAATVFIQQKYRALILMRRQTKEYISVRENVICVQSFYRGFKARKEIQRMHLAATGIQALFRMHKAKLAYQSLRCAAITIQTCYRSHLKRKRLKADQAVQKSTINQVTYRDTKTQPDLGVMHVSAIVIQSVYRMHVQRKRYRLICWAVTVIQSAYRGTIACKKAKKICAAQKSQFLHMAMDHRKLIQLRTEAVGLEALCHENEAREEYQKYWKAALLIQKHYRSYLTMKHQKMIYLQMHNRIIVMQATVRGFIERQRFSRIKRNVIIIQRWYRAKWQRRRYLQYREKIIIIQRMVRRQLSCRNKTTGGIKKEINSKTNNNGIIKFQALWRGYLWRKKTDTVETRTLRDSLIIANKDSKEEKKLCNRTAVAIDCLLKYKYFSYILAALKDLEVVTRLSPVCCENMAQSKAVFTIFALIRSCNRSVPSMDVIKYSVQILLNLSKYERTTDAVYTVENSIETLLDLLHVFRERAGDKISEKSGSIFTKTCCLFALLSKDSGRASEIRNNHRVVTCLQRLFKLTASKHQKDVQRMLVKQKSIPIPPVKTKLVSRQRPDWDLKKDNIREVIDPLQAIEMVMNTLGISCN